VGQANCAAAINNWESQDEPEYLRTIRDRILKDELKARDELIYSLVK
jgi:hypothetical protein